MKRVQATAAVLLAGVAGTVSAQAWPVKPVRVVIPWPPGGANDIAGRTVMAKLAAALGQQFVIDNRGGAAGTIGSEQVARASPDGHTLMVQSATHVANAHLYAKLPYDALRDFAPIGLISSQALVLTVHPSMPVRSVREFVALAKARPGEVIYSSAGNGSAPHLSMALFAQMTGTRMIHVPYKGGGPQVIALLGGESQASLAVIASLIGHIRGGRLRALGVSSLERARSLPDVPTIASAGVPGFEMSPWIGLFAPAGTPRPLIDRLNAELQRVLAQPDVAQSLADQGLDPWTATPDAFAQRLAADFEKYGRLVRLTGARVD